MRNRAAIAKRLVLLALLCSLVVGSVILLQRLLANAGLRQGEAVVLALSLMAAAGCLALLVAKLLGRILDAWLMAKAPFEGVRVPVEVTPEQRAAQEQHHAKIRALEDAIRSKRCPSCGEPSFQGGEHFLHAVDGFAAGGGLVGGSAYKLEGTCTSCGYSDIELTLR